MKKVISTEGYGVQEGKTVQITLPNGKFLYTGEESIREAHAREKGMECKVVTFYGACSYSNINQRAHMGFPIQINETSVKDFIDRVATEEEIKSFSI